jgi:alanyl aminopeptidase
VIDFSRRRCVALCCLFCSLSACATSQSTARSPAIVQPSAATPKMSGASAAGRLPRDVHPLAYRLELTIVPSRERFTGRTHITVALDAPMSTLALHGKDLHVTRVSAQAAGRQFIGKYAQLDSEGLAALRFDTALPAGQVVLELEYDAPFNRNLHGLFRVDTHGDSYAFSQFEALSAREAFPCFDEPSWKTPFDVWLTVPSGQVAASNTSVLAEEPNGQLKRVHFAQTKPLPTYLVAFAVGPLDVVQAPALAKSALRALDVPLRGLSVRGKGPLLAEALANVAPTLHALEDYFGIAYPYDKLDIVAVPDFGAGAMENAGLVTFRDSLLLIDPRESGEDQRRSSAFVLAHELAHQWVGDLVTMRYWDDLWLNEAFATWLEFRVLHQLHPEYQGELELVDDMQEAMQSDSRVSARMIRQPIESTHDIQNAFDSITYSKGGGVIGMFERYLGAAKFQRGVSAYLSAHAFGNASTEDLLSALDAQGDPSIGPAFSSFLTQVGVPLVAAEPICEAGQPARLALHQSRYLPLGSSGHAAQRWQIPVCVRYASQGTPHESCSLLSESTGSLALEGGCPDWLMPNAQASGYYRFTLPSAELEKLRNQGWPQLSAAERLSLGSALIAGFDSGQIGARDVLSSLAAFANDENRAIAVTPLPFLRWVRDHGLGQTVPRQRAFRAFVHELYSAAAQRLGYAERNGESGDAKLLRVDVLAALAELAEDAATRAHLAQAGKQYLGIARDSKLHPEALPNDLIDLGVRVFVQDAGPEAFQAVYERLVQSDDATQRGRYLRALSSVHDARSSRALELTLDPSLRVNEVMLPLRVQLSDLRTRAAAYDWFEAHFDALRARLSEQGMGGAPWLAAAFCDAATAARAKQFFASRADKLPGGPRSLDGVIETLELCEALVKAQGAGLDEFFSKH